MYEKSFDIVLLIVWLIVGPVVMISGLVDWVIYGCCWLCLILYMIKDIIRISIEKEDKSNV